MDPERKESVKHTEIDAVVPGGKTWLGMPLDSALQHGLDLAMLLTGAPVGFAALTVADRVDIIALNGVDPEQCDHAGLCDALRPSEPRVFESSAGFGPVGSVSVLEEA